MSKHGIERNFGHCDHGTQYRGAGCDRVRLASEQHAAQQRTFGQSPELAVALVPAGHDEVSEVFWPDSSGTPESNATHAASVRTIMRAITPSSCRGTGLPARNTHSAAPEHGPPLRQDDEMKWSSHV